MKIEIEIKFNIGETVHYSPVYGKEFDEGKISGLSINVIDGKTYVWYLIPNKRTGYGNHHFDESYLFKSKEELIKWTQKQNKNGK